jgi:cobalt-zinc-cadmium resistance protein CzcA
MCVCRGWQTRLAGRWDLFYPEGKRLETGLERAAYLRTVQDWIIRPQLKNVPGVAGVDSIGGFQKQYHVQPDPAKLIGLDLSFEDLATAIENNNLNRGARFLEDNGEPSAPPGAWKAWSKSVMSSLQHAAECLCG